MHRFAKHVGENLVPTMLRSNPRQTEFVDFLSPFGNKLRADNRWVKLASLMPWAVVEECYAESLAGIGMGRSRPSRPCCFRLSHHQGKAWRH